MKLLSAKEAKNSFGQLIERALIEPVAVTKHGRPVVVVVRFDEYERLMTDARPIGPHSGSPTHP